MQILILQGSPRAKGNTAWMAEEYKNAAEAAGHNVTLVNVSHKHIAGCLAKGVKVIMGEDANPLSDDYDALKEGTRVQTQLVGKAFEYEFEEATDYYLKAHLFGDIFARDNLTYADRELVTVSA